MKKIITIFQTHKELFIIILIILLVIINQFIYEPSQKQSSNIITPTPLVYTSTSYKNVVPGVSSLDQANKEFGDPVNKEVSGNMTVYDYKSSNENRFNQATVENGKVVFIKQVVNSEDNITTDNLTNKFGKATFILYPKTNTATFDLYVYPDKGLAYLGHIGGTVLEVWYFKPTTLEDFQKTWASNYSVSPATVLIQ